MNIHVVAMSFTSTVRVKEKIRYDINIHREQNKQILLNSRRGNVVEEQNESDVFTVEHMQDLALKIRCKNKITAKSLSVLKHALLNGQEFILAFCHVKGAIDSLLYYVSSIFMQLPSIKYLKYPICYLYIVYFVTQVKMTL